MIVWPISATDRRPRTNRRFSNTPAPMPVETVTKTMSLACLPAPKYVSPTAARSASFAMETFRHKREASVSSVSSVTQADGR